MGERYSEPDSGEEPADESRVSSDRGDSDTRQSQLHTIFLNVTGVEEFTDEQEDEQMSRYVDADTASVSAAVSAVAANDGLTDTIDESQSDEKQGSG